METVHGNYSIKLLFVEQILICLRISSLLFFFFSELFFLWEFVILSTCFWWTVALNSWIICNIIFNVAWDNQPISLILFFSSKVGWVIRLCFLFCLFFVFLIFCGRHWKSIFLFGGAVFYLPSCCTVNEVLSRVSTASHCRFKSSKMELTENKTNIWALVEAWPTKIHDHICHIFKAKIKRLVSRKLSVMNLWISLHSGDRISKEKKL